MKRTPPEPLQTEACADELIAREGVYSLVELPDGHYRLDIAMTPERFGPLTAENRAHFLNRFPNLRSIVEGFERRAQELQRQLEQLPPSLATLFEIDPTVHAVHQPIPTPPDQIPTPPDPVPTPPDEVPPPRDNTPGRTPFKFKLQVPSLCAAEDLTWPLTLAHLYSHMNRCLEPCRARFNEYASRYETESDKLFAMLQGDWRVGRRELPTLDWEDPRPTPPRELRQRLRPIQERLKKPGKANLRGASKAEAENQLNTVVGAYQRAFEARQTHRILQETLTSLNKATSLPAQEGLQRLFDILRKEWLSPMTPVDTTLADPTSYELTVDPLGVAAAWGNARLSEHRARKAQEVRSIGQAAALAAQTRVRRRLDVLKWLGIGGALGLVIMSPKIWRHYNPDEEEPEEVAPPDLDYSDWGDASNFPSEGPLNIPPLNVPAESLPQFDLKNLSPEDSATIRFLMKSFLKLALEPPEVKSSLIVDGNLGEFADLAALYLDRQFNRSGFHVFKVIANGPFTPVANEPGLYHVDLGVIVQDNLDSKTTHTFAVWEVPVHLDQPPKVDWREWALDPIMLKARRGIYRMGQSAEQPERSLKPPTEDPAFYDALGLMVAAAGNLYISSHAMFSSEDRGQLTIKPVQEVSDWRVSPPDATGAQTVLFRTTLVDHGGRVTVMPSCTLQVNLSAGPRSSVFPEADPVSLHRKVALQLIMHRHFGEVMQDIVNRNPDLDFDREISTPLASDLSRELAITLTSRVNHELRGGSQADLSAIRLRELIIDPKDTSSDIVTLHLLFAENQLGRWTHTTDTLEVSIRPSLESIERRAAEHMTQEWRDYRPQPDTLDLEETLRLRILASLVAMKLEDDFAHYGFDFQADSAGCQTSPSILVCSFLVREPDATDWMATRVTIPLVP